MLLIEMQQRRFVLPFLLFNITLKCISTGYTESPVFAGIHYLVIYFGRLYSSLRNDMLFKWLEKATTTKKKKSKMRIFPQV